MSFLRWERAGVEDRRWTQEGIEGWWQIIVSAVRDVAGLTVGVWILLFRSDATQTLQGIGFLLLTASAAGAARTAIRTMQKGNS